MTKRVRVENADNGTSYKVRVHVERFVDGQWVRGENSLLTYPAELTEEYIHGHQRLVVEEVTDE